VQAVDYQMIFNEFKKQGSVMVRHECIGVECILNTLTHTRVLPPSASFSRSTLIMRLSAPSFSFSVSSFPSFMSCYCCRVPRYHTCSLTQTIFLCAFSCSAFPAVIHGVCTWVLDSSYTPQELVIEHFEHKGARWCLRRVLRKPKQVGK